MLHRIRAGVAVAVLALCGQQPVALAAEALTTNQPADSLSFVDLATMKSVATLAIGGKPAGSLLPCVCLDQVLDLQASFNLIVLLRTCGRS